MEFYLRIIKNVWSVEHLEGSNSSNWPLERFVSVVLLNYCCKYSSLNTCILFNWIYFELTV